VIVAAIASTKVLSVEQAAEASQAGAFEPKDYATEHFKDDIVPAIKDNAVDLVTLLTDLAGGADESEFGNSAGSSSAFSFPVTLTGVAGAPNGSILPVTIEGLPEGTVVQVQIGPAINGTAIRDATGTVKFNDFTNQLEFQEVATEFNTLVKDQVLSDVDPATLEGKTITVTGAFTRVNPALVSVVPVEFEAAQ
jgi:predicted lipoprotein